MEAILPWIVDALVLATATGARGFYLPGVAPADFQKGTRGEAFWPDLPMVFTHADLCHPHTINKDPLPVKVNKLTSIETQTSISFYSLPYCQPDTIVDRCGKCFVVIVSKTHPMCLKWERAPDVSYCLQDYTQ